jgi:glycosyltransferase involved in cell wall biosynthesis
MIAFLQPHIPNYRQAFFEGINTKMDTDIYCYQNPEKVKNSEFVNSNIPNRSILAAENGGFLAYNPFSLLKNKYEVLVLMLHIGHLTTWLLLLTKFIHKKKIILWGHGISIKRYEKEERNPSIFLKWMIQLCDGVCLYTQKEVEIWETIFPTKKIIAINNTISGIEDIVETKLSEKRQIKNNYNIEQSTILIFCARFNSAHRRIDVLLETIKNLDSCKFGFIIIGQGNLKPDFSKYSNVYDFGAVYDRELKNKLFGIADIYFQPGWVGLSVVEAMAYGKPVFTFKRSKEVLQCVEYHYIRHNLNGFVFDSFTSFLETVNTISDEELNTLGTNAKNYAHEVLNMDNMIQSAVDLIKAVRK